MQIRALSPTSRLAAGLRPVAASSDTYAGGVSPVDDASKLRALARQTTRPVPGEVLAQMEKDAPVHSLMAETGMKALDQLAVDSQAARVALIGARVAHSPHFQAAVCKQGLEGLADHQDTAVGMARWLLDRSSPYYSREGREAVFAMLSYLQQESGPEGAELLDRTLDKLDGQLGKNPQADRELVTSALERLRGLVTSREEASRMRDALVAPDGAALKETADRLIVGGVAVKIRRPS